MSTVKGSKKQADLAKHLIAGAQTYFANAGSLTFAGGTFTPAQLQALAILRADAETAKAIARAKVAAERGRHAAPNSDNPIAAAKPAGPPPSTATS